MSRFVLNVVINGSFAKARYHMDAIWVGDTPVPCGLIWSVLKMGKLNVTSLSLLKRMSGPAE